MSQVRRYAQIVGWGMHVPAKVVSNEDLAQIVDTSDEWIRTRTGIRERRMVSDKESTVTLAVRAAEEALAVANCDPASLDLIIVATVTPDYIFPSASCLVQDALGARKAAAYDLGAGCSGFAYALSSAADSIIAGSYDTALVIGAETLSRILDWKDRGTCVLFGDGAGAVVLKASTTRCGVLASVLGADGSGGDLLSLPGSGFKDPVTAESRAQTLPYIRMNGNEVYRFATRTMGAVAQQAIRKAGLTLDEIDLLIPHQANLRIIQSAAKQLKLPAEKVFVNLERYGNTSAASIPIALCEAVETGRVKKGDMLVFAGFGAGLTWAANVVLWQPEEVEARRSWLGRLLLALRLRLAPIRSWIKRLSRRVDTVVGEATGDTELPPIKPKPPAEDKEHKDAAGKAAAESKEQAAGSAKAASESKAPAAASKPEPVGREQAAASHKPEPAAEPAEESSKG